MSAQKNKTVLAATLAIIGIFLLGGVSFSFFPAQTGLSSKPQVIPSQTSSNSPPNQLVIGAYNSSQSSYEFNQASIGGLAYLITSNNAPSMFVFRVEPLDSIVIAPDGTVNSTSIKRNGDTYTFTNDILNQTLVVQKNNVVVDGANHSIVGFNTGNLYAWENVHLENVTGITIKNLNLSLAWQAITVINCADLVIQNNTVADVNWGFYATAVNNSFVTENTFTNLTTAVSNQGAFGYGNSSKLTVSKNTISDVVTGISLSPSACNIVTDNVIVNAYDPIYADANSTVARNILINGIDAIGVTSNSRIYGNTISNFTESGILLSGENSTIYQNNVENCANAVAIDCSSDLYPLSNSIFYHNNFINNTQPLLLITNSSSASAYWDNCKVGNYWSSYNGSDGNGDGVGDTPYVLAANCTDNYPLMQPYQAASTDISLGNLFFAAAAVTALVGSAVIVCVYAKFRGHT